MALLKTASVCRLTAFVYSTTAKRQPEYTSLFAKRNTEFFFNMEKITGSETKPWFLFSKLLAFAKKHFPGYGFTHICHANAFNRNQQWQFLVSLHRMAILGSWTAMPSPPIVLGNKVTYRKALLINCLAVLRALFDLHHCPRDTFRWPSTYSVY